MLCCGIPICKQKLIKILCVENDKEWPKAWWKMLMSTWLVEDVDVSVHKYCERERQEDVDQEVGEKIMQASMNYYRTRQHQDC